MSWEDVTKFGVEHELCRGTTDLIDAESSEDGEPRMLVRCTGCGASIVTEVVGDASGDGLVACYEAIDPELAALFDGVARLGTDEARAQLFAAVEKRPEFKKLMEGVIARARRSEPRQ